MTCICAGRVVQARDHLSSIIVCVYSVNAVRPDWRNTKCRTQRVVGFKCSCSPCI